MIKLDLSHSNKLKNLELERNVLAGIFRFPEVFFDLEAIISPEDFTEKIHQNVWSIFGDLLRKNEKVDYRLVAYKIEELHISFASDFSVSEYFESIYFMGADEKTVLLHAQELKKLSGRKEIAQAGLDVTNAMLEASSDIPYGELVTMADSTFASKINLFELGGKDNQPIDLFKDLEAIIEEKGNDPKEDGIICPYHHLQRLYGNYTGGDLYVFAARAKTGKTSFLMNLALKIVSNLAQNTRLLILDTEIESYRLQYRLLSSMTGVSEYFIRNGSWRKNEDSVKKIRAAWPIVRLLMGKIDHVYVGSGPIDDTLSILRRWHKKHICGRDNILGGAIYDYFKLNSDFAKMGQNMRADISIGLMVDKVKKCASELQIPIISSVQTNRTNESRANATMRINDGSVISMSDQISQFSSNVFLLNRLTLEERQEMQTSFGIEPSHSLQNIYSRSQGPESPGFNDIVKVVKGDKVTWMDNLLYFSFEAFNMEELTTLSELVKERGDYKLNSSNNNEDGELL